MSAPDAGSLDLFPALVADRMARRDESSCGARVRRWNSPGGFDLARTRIRLGLILLGLFLGRCGEPHAIPGNSSLVVIEDEDGRRRIEILAPDGARRVLIPGFHAADGPRESFDGRRVLFHGQRSANESPAIWELDINTGHVRRLVTGNGDPADPAWLPSGRIVYSDRVSAADRSSERALFLRDLGGVASERLTFGAWRDERPEVLSSGRIAFERRPSDASDGEPGRRLTVRPDGTGVAAHVPGRQSHVKPHRVTQVDPSSGERVVRSHPVRVGWAPANRPSPVQRPDAPGTLLCQDIRVSRIAAVRGIDPASPHRIQVTIGDGRQREVPVEVDGSFRVTVPADRSLRLTLVDPAGETLAACDAGLWVRPKEIRGCVGCHESHWRVPANRFPLAASPEPSDAR